MQVAQDRVQMWAVVNTVTNFRKGRQLIGRTFCQLLSKDPSLACEASGAVEGSE
jgi:hypothetical protein